jgi:hypothetical protein
MATLPAVLRVQMKCFKRVLTAIIIWTFSYFMFCNMQLTVLMPLFISCVQLWLRGRFAQLSPGGGKVKSVGMRSLLLPLVPQIVPFRFW